MNAMQTVETFFETNHPDCYAEKVDEYAGLSVVTCKWETDMCPSVGFQLLVKDEKIYNAHLADVSSVKGELRIFVEHKKEEATDAKKVVERFFERYHHTDCTVEEVAEFDGFSIVTYKWWAQIGPHENFQFIVIEGKIYNGNFDDVEEIERDLADVPD